MTEHKRNRRTREEMLDAALAKVAKLQAQIEGSYKDEDENDVLKALKRRLRKTNTALRAARITLNGIHDDGKIARKSIAVTIQATRDRLESQIETEQKAEKAQATLPFDVERLEALIEATEAGELVGFPKDLSRLPNEQDRTDEEHEAAFIVSEQDSGN